MPVIKVSHLYKSFGSKQVLHDINLQVEKGEFFGLLGPNGAGKTTILKILTAQLEPTRGHVEVLATDPTREALNVKSKVGVVPEVESPPSYLNAEEYLFLVGRLRNVAQLNLKITRWLRFFEIEEEREIQCRALSKGTRQKLMIAAAFIHEPKLVFLDEPFANIDPVYQYKLKNFLRNYIKTGGTIFLCTHMLALAEELCSRLAIINKGRIVLQGYTNELTTNRKLETVFLGAVK